MDHLVWPVLLFLLGLLFLGLELFIPSGGMLGVLAAGSFVAAIWVGFMRGPWYGLGALAMTLLVVPIVIGVALHYWPQTPIGRLIFLPPPRADEVLPEHTLSQQRTSLVGQFGLAKSKMLPSGAISIGGRTYDAISRGHPIEAGDAVRVVAVHGNRLIVAPADPKQLVEQAEPSDALSQPIESLGIEPFDEPLA